MPYNHRPKLPWPTDDLQRKVLETLAPGYTATDLAQLLGLDCHKDARNAIDSLRKLSFNIENDPETGTFRFHPVARAK